MIKLLIRTQVRYKGHHLTRKTNGQDDDQNTKAWMNLSRLARSEDGDDEDKAGRVMRMYGWAATENWEEQRTEIDAKNSNEVNEDEAIMIDEDASSIDTMNGWNALKEMLEQGSSGDFRTTTRVLQVTP
jgi:hypothetical protein